MSRPKRHINNTGAMLTKLLPFGGKERLIPGLKTLGTWQRAKKAKATDGCVVRAKGTCKHGHRSWLVELGYA